jgi:hypothetical protein
MLRGYFRFDERYGQQLRTQMLVLDDARWVRKLKTSWGCWRRNQRLRHAFIGQSVLMDPLTLQKFTSSSSFPLLHRNTSSKNSSLLAPQGCIKAMIHGSIRHDASLPLRMSFCTSPLLFIPVDVCAQAPDYSICSNSPIALRHTTLQPNLTQFCICTTKT